MRQTNIALIGMPGSGKTTIGPLLAKDLRKTFIDTDVLIQQNRGGRLQNIISENGIDDFLATEERIVLELKEANCIIATGGSVIYSEAAMNYLKARSLIVYFQVSWEELRKRLHDPDKRGIVRKRGQTLKSLYNERMPIYRKYADITVDCSFKDIEDVVRITEEKVLSHLRKARRSGSLAHGNHEDGSSECRICVQQVPCAMRREGWKINRKRIHRMYFGERLYLGAKHRRKRRGTVLRFSRQQAKGMNDARSMDFVAD